MKQFFEVLLSDFSFLRLHLPKCRNKNYVHIIVHEKTGPSGSRTRDLSHPKRESCHQTNRPGRKKNYYHCFDTQVVAGVQTNDLSLPVVHVSSLFHFPCCRLRVGTIYSNCPGKCNCKSHDQLTSVNFTYSSSKESGVFQIQAEKLRKPPILILSLARLRQDRRVPFRQRSFTRKVCTLSE